MNGETKPGWKTSEFWITVIGAAVTMWQSVEGNIPQPWGPVVAAVLGAAYSISRAISKKS